MLDADSARALREVVARYQSDEVSLGDFGAVVLQLAGRDRATAVLAALPELERTQFEWWFVAAFGDRIPRRTLMMGSWNGEGPPPWERDDNPELVREAMHRAILARREPM